MPFGLKARIALNLAVIILASLLLLHFVCLITVRQLLIRERTESLYDLAQTFFPLQRGSVRNSAHDGTPAQSGAIPMVSILASHGISHALLQRDGLRSKIDLQPADARLDEKLQRLLNETLRSGVRRTLLDGRGGGLFGLAGRHLLIALPALPKESGAASWAAAGESAIGFVLPLDDLQQELDALKQVLLIYVLVNALLFSAIGFFRITRLTLDPLGRLLRRANEFKEEDFPFFQAGSGDNEFGRLSVALNRMLQHISGEKSKLHSTVLSLEAANRELKKTQEEMVRTEKLASVGRLSSGIAHEIGNPLGIILGYLELLKQPLLGDVERREFLDRAESELNRISRIIRELLDFSRSSAGGDRQPLLLHAVIAEVAEVIRHQPFMGEIELRLDLTAENHTIAAETDRLRQVILNLVFNAADAIAQSRPPGGGVLTIHTRQALVPAASLNGRTISVPGLILSVGDNGCGISGDCIGSIFDPFYTTKAPGKGTGLGLYVSFRMVEELGGRIHADSQAGRGTTIVIQLPLYAAAKIDTHGVGQGNSPSRDRKR